MHSDCEEPGRPCILLADDDLTVCLLAEEALRDIGIDLVTVTDGSAAAVEFDRRRPALVILDVEMPGQDGFAVCRHIRSSPFGRDTAIIMMTGRDDAESVERAYGAGATDFISKPIAWTVLPHRVRYVLAASLSLRRLHASEESNRQLLAALPDRLFLMDQEGTVLDDVSGPNGPGLGGKTFVGGRIEDFTSAATARQFREQLHLALASGEPRMLEYQGDTAERFFETRIIPESGGRILAVVRDVSERRRAEARIEHLAYFDTLTGLPNREYIVRELRRRMKAAKGDGGTVAALYVDLDRFKRINDTLGHGVGDALLKGAARRIQNCVRDGDTIARIEGEKDSGVQVARFGGDEFVVLLTGPGGDAAIEAVAKRIIAALNAPFAYKGHEFVVAPSIGIAIHPRDGQRAEDLLMNADSAMYQAKNNGRNAYRFYSTAMNARSIERLDLERNLHEAVKAGAFILNFQPKVTISGWSVGGCEVLLRWNHPVRGWVSPAQFIPVAEETGLIVPLGDWLIRQVCGQIREWQGTHLGTLRLAVNVSGQQFAQESFADTLLRHIWEAGIPPARLEIEITESLLMRNMEQTKVELGRLRDAGIAISVDDFGTGYSSLSYLKQFPLDAVKIDRSFVREMHMNRDDAGICSAIIAMARELHLKVVAEGVELDEQLAILRQQGCAEIQGYLFSKPVDAAQLAALLAVPANLGAGGVA